jgi:hypothetical protein
VHDVREKLKIISINRILIFLLEVDGYRRSIGLPVVSQSHLLVDSRVQGEMAVLDYYFSVQEEKNCSFPADFLGVIFLINVEYQMKREEDNVHGQYVEMGGGTL